MTANHGRQQAEADIRTLEAVEESIELARVDACGTVAWLVEIVETHPHPVLRHEAAFMLGQLRALTLIDDCVAETLCRAATSDSSTLVRHEATEALWNFDAPKVATTLARLIRDTNSDVAATAKVSLMRRRRRLRNPAEPVIGNRS